MTKRPLASLALTALLLAGCGGTTDVERDNASPSPMISTPIVSTQDIESPAVTVPSEVPSIDIPPSPSGAATETPGEVPNPLEPDGTPEMSSDTPVATSAPVSSVPATSAAASTATPDGGGTWTPMEVTVQTAAEATKLTGTSADFQAFVADRAGSPDASGCTNELTILAFHPDGYAAGQEFAPGCGGSQNIWGKQGGQWAPLLVMQSVVDCTDMANNDIPRGLPDIPCLDGKDNVVNW